ncbi:MAG: hypothetical protein GYB66_10050 [Chloroflexi bacterium]|nr:hypothetical protein [Chloroflexota bacterium]
MPINPQVDHSPWMTGPPTLAGTLQRLMNPADYRGYEGVNSGGANGVYWLEILENAPEGGLRVRNLVEHSRHPLPAVTTEIEEELVYPLLRGRDVRRWTAQAEKAVLLVQDPDTQRGYREAWLQTTLPKTHAYLAEFEAVLRRRSAYRRYFQRSDAFYTMFGVGPYTLAPYKVVWRYIAKELTAAVVLPDPVTGKVLIPDHRLILVPAAGADEAHYLAACLNSTPSRAIVAAYAITTQLSTHILQHVPVPRFDQANPLHQALAQAGKQAQAATQSGEAVAPHEAKIDQLVADLWQVRATELAEMGASLRQD